MAFRKYYSSKSFTTQAFNLYITQIKSIDLRDVIVNENGKIFLFYLVISLKSDSELWIRFDSSESRTARYHSWLEEWESMSDYIKKKYGDDGYN